LAPEVVRTRQGGGNSIVTGHLSPKELSPTTQLPTGAADTTCLALLYAPFT
jgi:hypothetical protein